MTELHKQKQIEDLLRLTGCGDVLEIFTPSNAAAAHYLGRLNAAIAELRSRHGLSADEPSIAVLCDLQSTAPYELTAFMQTVAVSRTPQMIAMAWRLITGSSVKRFNATFDDPGTFELSVICSRDDVEEEFESHDVNDKRLLSQIALCLSSGGPKYLGYFGIKNFP